MSGCYPIVAIDIYEDKLKEAIKLGATHAVNSLDRNYEKLILQSNSNANFDICIDNTGLPDVLKTA